jgi:polysaccharide export outer membrane protein
MVSCTSTKKVTYFTNLKDTAFRAIQADPDPMIHANDLLSITVTSANPEASMQFNAPVISAAPASNAATNTASPGVSPGAGYLVNPDGHIQFPVLGNIAAAGMTKNQLRDNITNTLLDKKLLVDPIVNVRFLNFKVTVLGEVARPTVISVPNEKISILEAIGLAGDLTVFARRDNVLVIREEDGKKVIKRLNLNSAEIFTSPYYYLKSNDVVYAEPTGNKVAATSTFRQTLPLVLSILSLAIVALTRI